MSWSTDDEVAAKPLTAATDVPESGQVTSENFLSPHSARLNGSDFRSTNYSDRPDVTWRDAQIRLRLDTARVLRKAVEQQFQARPKASMKDWAGTGLRQKLQKKVAATESLLRHLHTRIEGTESMKRKVTQSVGHLEREQQSLEEPAIICERRLLIREQRPDGDTEDDFQVALLQERCVLEQGHKMLSAYIDAGTELQEALQAAKSEMIDDVQFKRHALRLEKSALQFDPYHGRDRACVLPLVAEGKSNQKPSRPQAPREDERWSFGATFLSLEKEDEWSEENTSKESVQRSAYHTQELIGRTHELEENATKFVEDSVALLQRVKEKLQAAMDGTTSSMQMSINRLVQQKKELEKGLADSQEDIIRTERLLQHLQHEIHSQKASLDEWEAAPEISLDRLDQRLPLAVQQDIRQSAFERMQEQVHNAKSNVYVLSNKCEGSKDLLSQLREANAELREHLAAKTACWRIDLQCAKLKAGAKDTPRAQVSKANDSLFVVPTPVRLSNRMLNTIRTKIKTAAYEGPQGHGFDVMFNRFDQDGSGSLTAREVRRALRRSLRIPEGTLSDQQIISLCAWLDIDGSGLVEIDDLVAFLSVEPQIEPPRLKSTVELEGQASNRSFELDCFVTPRRSQATQTRSKAPPLSKGLLSTLRSKMKAASYAGHLGCDLKALFSRFDHTGTGVLEEEQLRQVIRRAMRIAPSVISDAQIAKLCTMLDKEALGAIGIDTLVDFVSKDPERGGRNLHNE